MTGSDLQRRRLLSQRALVSTPALFVDRDGVLIEDRHYLADPRDVVLCAGVKDLLGAAFRLRLPVVVITNQSGITRGLFTWDVYECVTDRMLRLLGGLAPVSAIYASGHGPDTPDSTWRKPGPGMLQQAASDLNLSLEHSLLIGDRLTDLQAGEAAGLPWLLHVRSGHGLQERELVERWAHNLQKRPCAARHVEITWLEALADVPLDRLPTPR